MRLLAILIAAMFLTAPLSAQSQDSSLRGTLLVAARHLDGSSFAQTVILIVHNDDDGSAGVTVNRPSDLTVADALPGEYDRSVDEYNVYAGGPVATERLSMLWHTDRDRPGMERLSPGVAFTAYAPLFDRLIGRHPAPADIRVIAGLAGWAPGQLEHEIENGDWYIVPADSQLVFSEAPNALWRRLIRRFGDDAEPPPQSL